jgi:hypothetical protein
MLFFLEYEMHISAMLKFLGLSCDIILYLSFSQVLLLLLFCQIFVILTRIFLEYFSLENSCWIFCRIMSAGSSPRRVRHRLVEDRAAIQTRIMDRSVIAERNVLRADMMGPPLDNILDIIQTYNWGYLHSCACVVYTRLVKLFYANLEVVQNDDHGVVLQSFVAGYLITVDPQVIIHIIRVPVLEILASPYNEVVLPPSLDDLREFFRVVPQSEERSTAIWIGALSSTHSMLAKIIQQNMWPVARCSDLILKQAQFVYAIHLCLPFCLCKHILGVILEAHDESTAGLPFGCLLTQIILQSGINVNCEPKMKIQQPISKQTLMKFNAQLRRDDSDDEVPPPTAMPVGFPDMASSSHTVPPSEPEVNYAQIMEALAALQRGMSSMQVSMYSMQQSMCSMQQSMCSMQ